MTPDEIEKYKKLVEDIGLGNKKGYIFIGEVDTDTDLGMNRIEGLGFVNNVPSQVLLESLLGSIGGVNNVEITKIEK